MTVQQPDNEAARIDALRRHAILDTAPEEAFDDLTRLAAAICGAPIALVNFIDEDRLWCKAALGLGVTEMARDIAFCTHTILRPDVTVVPDLRADERFADNPLVIGDPFLRFYAGMPLITADGQALGTVCDLDYAPRQLNADQTEALRALARQAPAQLALRQTVSMLEQTIAARQQADDALRHQLAFTNAMTNSLGDGVYALDRDGCLTFMNRAAEQLLGWTEAELRGKPMHEAIHYQRADGTLVPAEECPLLEVIQSGRTACSDEDVFTRKDGTIFPVSYTSSPMRMDDRVAGAVLMFRDLTEPTQTNERLRLLESVVVNANDAVLITEAEPVDLPGPRILYVNEAFTRMTGYTQDEVVGRTPRLLQGPGTDRAALDKIRQALKRWKSVRVELVNHHRDGTPFWVELNIAPVANAQGWYTHWVSVQRETTARRRTEEALQLATREAESANLAKSDFLSRMSHELRTPLNAILGFAQLLEMDALGEEQQDSVEHILKAGRHLLTLINEVLDIARIEAGRLALSLEPVNVAEIVREAHALISPLAAGRTVHLDGDAADNGGDAGGCDQYILADRQRIKQVLLNLLSNAVKYTRPGDTIVLACWEGAPGRLRIAVRDTGPGIAADKLDRLFTPFERLGAEQTGVEGTGIGLALSMRLVEAMGGTIEVRSTVDPVDHGSVFTVELPLANAPVARLEPARASADIPMIEPATTRTVLYIEDNLPNLQLIERILAARRGVTLLSALQGRLGLELAHLHLPDLILLDLHLPDISGTEVLRRLRDDPATRDIPVVVISADATSGQIDRLTSAGAYAYLTKPFDVRQLLGIVDDILRDVG